MWVKGPMTGRSNESANAISFIEEMVDRCLELVGPVKAGAATLQQLVEHAAQSGELTWDTEKDTAESTAKVGELLQLIASVKEFQYC